MSRTNGFGFVRALLERSDIVVRAGTEDDGMLLDPETIEAIDALLLEERMLGIVTATAAEEPFCGTVH